MINFRIYSSNTKYADMNIKNLEVGQTLYRLVEDRYNVTASKIVTYTISKILKTRLVLVNENGEELRLLVENSKYSSYRNGDVTDTREGTSDNYRRTSYRFATEDDKGILEGMVSASARETERKHNRIDARNKVQAFSDRNLESIEAAIQALQVLADDLRTEDSE